ncbi:plasmalemma vesicle-associated protein [Bombina bombina]|uniref:plasmalemma vesicle-associated protein n=1 Tax=Bombina bombina TaxID=8345 RepID=UPI00235A6442|nr:plasmalemma vesicle-associated protein [Bombina bombina]XP_053558689.1 plasmalemma vesicle-associated protein [Bombina bombina]
MDRSYAMAKFGLESKDILRSTQKDCWYYCKYFFLFTSIIQFLIILSLILFMLYGNMHTATDERLQTVEQLNQVLLLKNQNLNANYSKVQTQINNTEKEKNACNALLQGKKQEVDTMNKTLQIQMVKMTQLTAALAHAQAVGIPCKTCIERLNILNISCYAERLTMREEKNIIDFEYKNYKENCTKTISIVTEREQQAHSEREKYRLDKIDVRNKMLDAQEELLKFRSSCASFEDKFNREIQRMKDNYDATISKYTSSFSDRDQRTLQNCNPFTSEIQHKIETALINLRQDIISTTKENTYLKVSKDRAEENKKQCDQEKTTILGEKKSALDNMQRNWDTEIKKAYEEKDFLRKEKDETSKQLKEKTDSLTTIKTQLESKMRELQHCLKMIPSSNMVPPLTNPFG